MLTTNFGPMLMNCQGYIQGRQTRKQSKEENGNRNEFQDQHASCILAWLYLEKQSTWGRRVMGFVCFMHTSDHLEMLWSSQRNALPQGFAVKQICDILLAYCWNTIIEIKINVYEIVFQTLNLNVMLNQSNIP